LLEQVMGERNGTSVTPAVEGELQAGKPSNLLDRDRIMNDMTNTGTVGALIGGFALSIFNREFKNVPFEFATGVIIFLSVHLCTFAALSSAIIYRRVNCMDEDGVAKFVAKWSHIIGMPQKVFVVGCFCYLVGVILLGIANHGGLDAHHNYPIAFSICGGMCCLMIGYILLVVQ